MPPEDPGAALSRQWLLRAQRDLKTADRLAADADLAGMVTFHCQQAAEKALKGYLASRNQPFRRTHDLRELLGQCLVGRSVLAATARHAGTDIFDPREIPLDLDRAVSLATDFKHLAQVDLLIAVVDR